LFRTKKVPVFKNVTNAKGFLNLVS